MLGVMSCYGLGKCHGSCDQITHCHHHHTERTLCVCQSILPQDRKHESRVHAKTDMHYAAQPLPCNHHCIQHMQLMPSGACLTSSGCHIEEALIRHLSAGGNQLNPQSTSMLVAE